MKIIFDGMNIAYRCFSIHDKKQNLKSSSGHSTGLLYGFLRTMLKWKKEYPQSEFFVAWDKKNSGQKRKSSYEGYKGGRPDDSEEKEEFQFYDQVSLLQEEFLPSMGVHQFLPEEREADDVIGTFVRDQEGAVVIVSNDKDFLQLISDDTVVITPNMKKTYDREFVEEEYGVPPKWILPFRALEGDSSDNLPGLPYFRKKIIAKLIREYEGDLKQLYEGDFPDHLTEKESSKLGNFRDQAFQNVDLMELKEVSYKDIPSDADREKLSSLCDRFEFQSIKGEMEKFPEKKGFVKTN